MAALDRIKHAPFIVHSKVTFVSIKDIKFPEPDIDTVVFPF